jgi:phage shock protein C
VKARTPFRLDRSNGKMLGVCAGVAEHFDIDVTLVRVAFVLAVLTLFPVVLIAYFITAAIAGGKERRCFEQPKPALARIAGPRAETMRNRLSDLDARLQAIETEIVDNRNCALAREIDALR